VHEITGCGGIDNYLFSAYNVRMTFPKGLMWTPVQVEIYKLLQEGKWSFSQIQKQVGGVSLNIISRVKKSMEKGQFPPSEKLMLEPPEEDEKNEPSEKPVVSPAQAKNVQAAYYQPSLKGVKVDPSLASFLKIIPTAVNCQLTPIMYMARNVAIKHFQWNPDMTWEDFFDTCLYYLFKHWGVVLQAYIVQEEEGEASPVPAPEQAGGNGNLDMDALALKVAEVLIAKANTQQGG
jgi:hypothetical protein